MCGFTNDGNASSCCRGRPASLYRSLNGEGRAFSRCWKENKMLVVDNWKYQSMHYLILFDTIWLYFLQDLNTIHTQWSVEIRCCVGTGKYYLLHNITSPCVTASTTPSRIRCEPCVEHLNTITRDDEVGFCFGNRPYLLILYRRLCWHICRGTIVQPILIFGLKYNPHLQATKLSKQPIRARYLDHVTGCQPIKEQ